MLDKSSNSGVTKKSLKIQREHDKIIIARDIQKFEKGTISRKGKFITLEAAQWGTTLNSFSLVIFFLFPNLNLNFQSRTAFPFLVYSRDTRIGPKAADCIQINFSFQGFPHISRYIKIVDFSLSENKLFWAGNRCARGLEK